MRLRYSDEMAIGAVLSAGALFYHSLWWRSAGPLWRDEVDSAVIAASPWPQLADRMQFLPFPAVWMLLVRGWIGLFTDSVVSLRVLGALTGVALLAAMWYAMRALGARAPIIAIALAGAAATIVRYGDSLRAYGLGAALGLVSMALLYRTCVEPTRRNFILAALASLAAVHTTYHNAPLLFACCVAAAIVHRDRKRAAIVLGIGVLCAASLLLYLPIILKATRWGELVRYDVDLPWILRRFREAAEFGSGGVAVRAWVILLAAALALAAVALWRARGRDSVLLFCTITLVVYTFGHIAFLRELRYIMQAWYWLIWMVVAAVLIDAILARAFEPRPSLQLIRGAAAFVILLFAYEGTSFVLGLQATNIDRVAGLLQREATPRDLIVVYPWHLGVSFNRYYRGAAAWQTLPPLPDHSVQRYDEAQEAIRDTPERSVVDGALAALHRGGRVWYVGFPLNVEKNVAVHPGDQANERVVADIRWSQAFERALGRESITSTTVIEPKRDTIGYENVWLLRIERQP